METEFRSLILGLGLMSAERINWGTHPQGLGWPGIVLTMVDDFVGLTLDGVAGVSSARVQVDIYAVTFVEARALAASVDSQLQAYRGGVFRKIFRMSRRAGRDTQSEEAPIRISADYSVRWNSA